MLDDNYIAMQLVGAEAPVLLRDLCEELGLSFPSSRRWSRVLHRQYAAVSAAMQRLRRAGRVRYVRATQASGWELAA